MCCRVSQLPARLDHRILILGLSAGPDRESLILHLFFVPTNQLRRGHRVLVHVHRSSSRAQVLSSVHRVLGHRSELSGIFAGLASGLSDGHQPLLKIIPRQGSLLIQRKPINEQRNLLRHWLEPIGGVQQLEHLPLVDPPLGIRIDLLEGLEELLVRVVGDPEGTQQVATKWILRAQGCDTEHASTLTPSGEKLLIEIAT
mmetsp:Transcript_26692/g.64293  ORF Transcript_26692/g.64293 Transcript_26692/m.64293 type:complete len:200 (+) Transcript_26692:112-711(+)